jgi:hypothetical protein
MAKAIGHLGKTAGKGTFNQLYFTQRLGRSLTGAGILTLGYILASLGLITGAPDKGEKKAAFDRAIGKMSYAIKTDDGYVAYDWAQPVGALLAIGADAQKSGMKKNDFLGKIIAAAEGAGNTFFNMSMLKSLTEFASYGNPVGGLTTVILGSGSQFTPTLMKQAAKMFDKYERDTQSDSKLQTVVNRLMESVPGLRQRLPAKLDAYNQPIEVQEGYGTAQKIFNLAVNPANVTKSNMKDYEKEVDRIYNISKNSDILPSTVDKVIKDNGKDYPLTNEQYAKYKNLYGDIVINGYRDKKTNRLLIQGIKDVINSDKYKKLTDAKKEELLAYTMKAAYNGAKNLTLKEIRK